MALAYQPRLQVARNVVYCMGFLVGVVGEGDGVAGDGQTFCGKICFQGCGAGMGVSLRAIAGETCLTELADCVLFISSGDSGFWVGFALGELACPTDFGTMGANTGATFGIRFGLRVGRDGGGIGIGLALFTLDGPAFSVRSVGRGGMRDSVAVLLPPRGEL